MNASDKDEHPFILIWSWKRLIETERISLEGELQSNAATIGFEKTGLFPFRMENKMWVEWIERVRVLQSSLEITIDSKNNYLVPKLKSETLNLTDEEKKMLEEN